MAVGYWKSPTEATYLASSDASQNQRLDGMPFGTRGGIVARHDFPADGEYKFSIQNFGVGSFIPGEQLALIIDGERAHVWPYRGVGLAVGMTADGDGTLEVTVPVRAGSRLVGATFIATNYRPSLDIDPALRPQVAREQLDPADAELPGDRVRAHSGPVQRAASARLGEPAQGLDLPAVGEASTETACARADPHHAGAPRLPPPADGAGDRDG